MEILVINCGSSSAKSTVIESETGRRLVDIRIEGIGEAHSTLRNERAVLATRKLMTSE